MLDQPAITVPEQASPYQNHQSKRTQRLNLQPFKKESQMAQKRREEREMQRKEVERRNRERKAKVDERERHRKAMAKARGKDGQRKLGRESKVLLDKVQRLVREQPG